MKKLSAEYAKKLTPPNPKHHFWFVDGYEKDPEYQYYLSSKKEFGWDSYLRMTAADGLKMKVYVPSLAYLLTSNVIELHVRELMG